MKRPHYEYFDDETPSSPVRNGTLCRSESQFVRDASLASSLQSPGIALSVLLLAVDFSSYVLDWQSAWTSFLNFSSLHKSFHNNFVLKGHWAGLEFLVSEFETEAARISKVLVSELHLNESEKTIKPISVGGMAGGFDGSCFACFV